METFTAELQQRITAARHALRTAHEVGDLDSERVYSGELDSLLRLAMENGVSVPADDPGHQT